MSVSLPELLYSSSDSVESKKINDLLKAGKIRKILPKAFTSNSYESDEEIIRKYLFQLIHRHYPEAILSHRSALEFQLSPESNIYLTSTQNRVVKWGDIQLKFTKGHERLDTDKPTFGGLYVSSMERAFLENLTSSRTSDGESKILDESVIEEKLLMFLNKAGEKGLNEFRDKARVIAEQIGMQKEFEKLNKKISAILSTKSSNILKSPVAIAQAFGEPYDAERLKIFQKLAAELRNSVFEKRDENATNTEMFRTFAFFESYFSNYIEGTTFEVEEAIDIVYKNKTIPNRVGDTHDVRGTFEVCSSKFEMKKAASTSNEFLELLQERHSIILKGRPDKEPGIFKEKANRAGDTYFVAPNMVKGTLKAGFEGLMSIPSAFGKAIYMMFVVSEVHPFNDGNGRIARIMMNSEFVQTDEQRILMPTAYREDYLGALRRLTRQSDLKVYIKMMDRIHRYSQWLNPSSFDEMLEQLRVSNAFNESNQAPLKWENISQR